MTEGQNEPLADQHQPELAHAQRLGFVPTWWFWRDPNNWALARGPAAVLVGVVTFAVAISGLPPALAGLIAPLMFLAAVGLLERYIRAQTHA